MILFVFVGHRMQLFLIIGTKQNCEFFSQFQVRLGDGGNRTFHLAGRVHICHVFQHSCHAADTQDQDSVLAGKHDFSSGWTHTYLSRVSTQQPRDRYSGSGLSSYR
jgi:hypothetical protein